MCSKAIGDIHPVIDWSRTLNCDPLNLAKVPFPRRGTIESLHALHVPNFVFLKQQLTLIMNIHVCVCGGGCTYVCVARSSIKIEG